MRELRRRIGRPLKEHRPDDVVSITVHLPGWLKTKVQRAAVAEYRSLGGEIALALSRVYGEGERPAA